MYPGGYTAEITNLSPRSTEKDVYDFFAHCGAVEYIEIIRFLSIMYPGALIHLRNFLISFFLYHLSTLRTDS